MAVSDKKEEEMQLDSAGPRPARLIAWVEPSLRASVLQYARKNDLNMSLAIRKLLITALAGRESNVQDDSRSGS